MPEMGYKCMGTLTLGVLAPGVAGGTRWVGPLEPVACGKNSLIHCTIIIIIFYTGISAFQKFTLHHSA